MESPLGSSRSAVGAHGGLPENTIGLVPRGGR
jgi:hypothetical protein